MVRDLSFGAVLRTARNIFLDNNTRFLSAIALFAGISAILHLGLRILELPILIASVLSWIEEIMPFIFSAWFFLEVSKSTRAVGVKPTNLSRMTLRFIGYQFSVLFLFTPILMFIVSQNQLDFQTVEEGVMQIQKLTTSPMYFLALFFFLSLVNGELGLSLSYMTDLDKSFWVSLRLRRQTIKGHRSPIYMIASTIAAMEILPPLIASVFLWAFPTDELGEMEMGLQILLLLLTTLVRSLTLPLGPFLWVSTRKNLEDIENEIQSTVSK